MLNIKLSERHGLIFCLIAFNVIDILLTAIGVWGLGFRELNPLINIMLLWTLMIVKMILILFVSWQLLNEKIPLWVHKLMCWIMIFIIAWNLLNIIADLLF